MTVAWVVGSGGLLGRALCRGLHRRHIRRFDAGPLDWADLRELRSQIDRAIVTFASTLSETDDWQLYWAAGIGTMGSRKQELEVETSILSHLLERLGQRSDLVARRGGIVFSSSAGAIYAGCHDDPICERSQELPTTDYGRSKLEQERIVRGMMPAGGRWSALVARLSTLYGPGQSMGKGQGLIAHIARSVLRNRPVRIFVPLDTIRDYLHVDDAADEMICGARSLRGGQIVTRIVASERATTIAEILGAFRRVAHRAPRIITSASPITALYSHRVQFRSCDRRFGLQQTSLGVGIARLLEFERRQYAAGSELGRETAR